jgi:hypothetical protein
MGIHSCLMVERFMGITSCRGLEERSRERRVVPAFDQKKLSLEGRVKVLGFRYTGISGTSHKDKMGILV